MEVGVSACMCGMECDMQFKFDSILYNEMIHSSKEQKAFGQRYCCCCWQTQC
jgi:hypothetical protein